MEILLSLGMAGVLWVSYSTTADGADGKADFYALSKISKIAQASEMQREQLEAVEGGKMRRDTPPQVRAGGIMSMPRWPSVRYMRQPVGRGPR
jgi:hypothetical protein